MTILITAAVSFLWQVASHYLPIRKGAHEIINYTAGTMGILMPFTAWAYLTASPFDTCIMCVWSCAVSSGVATLACYALDKITNHEDAQNYARRIEDLYRETQ